MRLDDAAPSKNFEDRTGGSLSDSFHDMMSRLLYPFMKMAGRTGTMISPWDNDEYIRRRDSLPKRSTKELMNDSITKYSPEEQKLIRENGFGIQDILVMRQYKAAKDKSKFRVEEDGSISPR